MLTATKTLLNPGQQAAADGFLEFLFSPQKELIISGPGGVGKTFLMGQLIDSILPQYYQACELMGTKPEYDSVVMTATTNKAAEVLGLATNRPTQTIHSFLNLKVTDDYTTGRSKLTKTRAWKVHERMIIFVDECSMIDSDLRQVILEGTHKCKIVYVGDHCQLAPVMESLSPIYLDQLPFHELTEPMRNAGQPALMAVCNQLRQSVETGIFKPIQIVPGVIDHLQDNEMADMIRQTFTNQNREARILAYTNSQVIAYNDYIRGLRQLPAEYTKGELLVNNNAIQLQGRMLSVEEELEIIHQSGVTQKENIWNGAELEVRRADFRTRLGHMFYAVPLPVNRDHYVDLMNYFKKRKEWVPFFKLKNNYPDLRPRDAATIHKAQGSTHDTVFIDVGNLSTCHQPNVVARLLYVGFTRARQRVILYGDLAKKYGGLLL